jgi:SAM-dependent methyltransferase
MPQRNALMPVDYCRCCGSRDFVFTEVLWKALTDEWRLAAHEVDYINRQQGLRCAVCGSSLRSMALAQAIMRQYSYAGLLQDFVGQPSAQALRVLEINEAGEITRYLQQLPKHRLITYPDADMMQLAFPDDSYDLIVHADTLEHIEQPVRALSECARVLQPGGVCAFTIPIVVERMTCSRIGLPPSYHGAPTNNQSDYMVHTEYGCDAWKQVFLAGFAECRIFSLEYPAAQALIGIK